MDTTAVILAVASPPGRSLRGIVRASGPGCFALLEPHVPGPWSRAVRCTHLRADGLELACIVHIFEGPRSYTGEDSVEIQIPGNPALLTRVIETLLVSGRRRDLEVRRAEAGEFSARAFLNGRLSLTEAEGVAATIAARSDAQLRAAGLLAAGALGRLAHELSDTLAGALALVEAGIDFTDQEDVVAIAPRELLDILVPSRDRVETLLARSVGTEQLEAIPWVVLTGETNAGKSTLFNALLGHPRAVVGDAPGTTRDGLNEPLTIQTPQGPAEIMLVDLAGADPGESLLNRQMQSAARQAIDRAELVIHCVPDEPARASPGDRELLVRTKSDLASTPGPPGSPGPPTTGVAVSAVTGAGITTLLDAIAGRLANRAVSLAADALALEPRHEAALRGAQYNLDDAIELVHPVRDQRQLPQPELVAAALRLALDDLATLAGNVTPDDVLGRIFATFCVGK